ncbi:hypothetical protein V8C42DRAFT_315966 [Trichoderma barbatum]
MGEQRTLSRRWSTGMLFCLSVLLFVQLSHILTDYHLRTSTNISFHLHDTLLLELLHLRMGFAVEYVGWLVSNCVRAAKLPRFGLLIFF